MILLSVDCDINILLILLYNANEIDSSLYNLYCIDYRVL